MFKGVDFFAKKKSFIKKVSKNTADYEFDLQKSRLLLILKKLLYGIQMKEYKNCNCLSNNLRVLKIQFEYASYYFLNVIS